MRAQKILQKRSSLVAAFLSILFGVTFALRFPAWALEPPRPGEIEKLKAEGKIEASLEMAKELANHKAEPFLLERAAVKIKRQILESRGMPKSEVNKILPLPAPPPAWRGMPTTGNVKTFALLIEFNDYPHSVSQTDINDMLYGGGNAYSYFPLESLTNYYSRSSYGLLDLGGGSTLGWYRTSYDRSAVPETTQGRENLIREALNYFDSVGHDFSQYDNDGDGAIDYFIVMWTGPIGSWATFWWGYYTGWSDSSYLIDGKRLNRYSWQWESSTPTVVLHETGHALGLPDLYDYDDSVGPPGGVGGFDMMDANQWDHNCFSKWILDWLAPIVVSGENQDIILDDSGTSSEAVLIWPGIGSDGIFGEFFMIQNRQRTGNDTYWSPDGLAIWHIDARLDPSGSYFLYNNSYSDHKYVRLMEADGLEQIEKYWGFHPADLYNEGTEFGPNTLPSSHAYDGSDSCVRVRSISDLGIEPGAKIRASFDIAPHYVPDDFSTIQEALNAATDGWTIIVRDGSYTGAGNKDLDFQGKAVTLRSEGGPANCIIDCEGNGRAFRFRKGEDSSTILDGFTITNGYAVGSYPDNIGGAISCADSSPVITNCIIKGNYADYGGALYCGTSSAAIIDCTIENNTSSQSGGGIFCYDGESPLIVNSIIRGNSSRSGGGINVGLLTHAVIKNCTIAENSAIWGGGVSFGVYAYATMVNCIIIENSAENGGGIFVTDDSPNISFCTIVGNSASLYGGGLNCDSTSALTNSVLWSNLADVAGSQVYVGAGSFDIDYCDVQYGEDGIGASDGSVVNWGTSNIDAAPLFVGGGDYHLTACSPCIDSGTDAGTYDDIDGEERPLGTAYDMGADEYSGDAGLLIAGRVLGSTGSPISGVIIGGLPHNPITDTDGYYQDCVSPGWSGTATPSKAGFTFTPASRSYNNVTSDQSNQDYTGASSLTVSGYVRTASGTGIEGVVMAGLPGSPVTDANGFYGASVSMGWAGRVTPAKEGYMFKPRSRRYSKMVSDQAGQNYYGLQKRGRRN